MMNARDAFLSQAYAHGASFILRGGHTLVLRRLAPLPAELKAELPRQKPAIVAAFLASCGWCASPRLWVAPESGRRYGLDRRAVFNPSRGRWAPGEREKRRLTHQPGREADTLAWP
jgi:hypothetical protein